MRELGELTSEQQALVAKHYDDAIRIGQAFKSSLLFDDEKENVAVQTLWRAAKGYNKKHESKASFQTYLYQSITNALISHGQKNRDGKYHPYHKRLPKSKLLNESVIEANAAELGQVKSIATMFAVMDNNYDFEFEQLLSIIKTRLTEKQEEILNMLVAPELFGQPVSNCGTPKITYLFIAETLGITKQRVHQEILEIRRIAKGVIDNSSSRFLKAAKEPENG